MTETEAVVLCSISGCLQVGSRYGNIGVLCEAHQLRWAAFLAGWREAGGAYEVGDGGRIPNAGEVVDRWKLWEEKENQLMTDFMHILNSVLQRENSN